MSIDNELTLGDVNAAVPVGPKLAPITCDFCFASDIDDIMRGGTELMPMKRLTDGSGCVICPRCIENVRQEAKGSK